MAHLQVLAALLVFASLRFLPVMAIPSLSPLSWAPGMVRAVLLLGLSWLSVLSLSAWPAMNAWSSPMALVLSGLAELLLGFTFAIAIWMPQAAIGLSARLADMQAGLSAASLFNPSGQHEPESMLGTLMLLAATVLFFVLDLHVLLFRALSASVRVMPLGLTTPHLDAGAFLDLLGNAFLLGLALMAPLIVGLFALDLGVAYATRSMPQANVYFLALPLKVVVALLLLAASLRFAPTLIGRLYQDAFARLPAVLGG